MWYISFQYVWVGEMDRCCCVTDAPLPQWLVMDDEQETEIYHGVQELEKLFREEVGAGIGKNYVDGLQFLFEQIHRKIGPGGTALRSNICSHLIIINGIAKKAGRVVIVDDIVVRPCAQKMGFFRLVLWQMVQSCKRFNLRLVLRSNSSKIKRILGQISNKFVAGGEVYPCISISSEDIAKMNIEQFGIQHMLKLGGGLMLGGGGEVEPDWHLVLNANMLPSAAQFNSQAWVDSRDARMIIPSTDDAGDVDELEKLLSMSALAPTARHSGSKRRDAMEVDLPSERRFRRG